MKDALRAIPFTGAFGSITVFHKIIDERSVQRSGRSGMVQSAIRSLRRNHGFYNPTTQEERSGRRCEQHLMLHDVHARAVLVSAQVSTLVRMASSKQEETRTLVAGECDIVYFAIGIVILEGARVVLGVRVADGHHLPWQW